MNRISRIMQETNGVSRQTFPRGSHFPTPSAPALLRLFPRASRRSKIRLQPNVREGKGRGGSRRRDGGGARLFRQVVCRFGEGEAEDPPYSLNVFHGNSNLPPLGINNNFLYSAFSSHDSRIEFIPRTDVSDGFTFWVNVLLSEWIPSRFRRGLIKSSLLSFFPVERLILAMGNSIAMPFDLFTRYRTACQTRHFPGLNYGEAVSLLGTSSRGSVSSTVNHSGKATVWSYVFSVYDGPAEIYWFVQKPCKRT